MILDKLKSFLLGTAIVSGMAVIFWIIYNLPTFPDMFYYVLAAILIIYILYGIGEFFRK
jgi:hypothetical protein